MDLPASSDAFKIINEILEEKNIVTCKWLSRKLQVYNSLAEKLLQEFINSHSKEKYFITYAICGKEENGDLILALVNEKDLLDFQEKIKISSKHIYSIQFSHCNFDCNTVFNEDKATYNSELNHLTSIKYPQEIIRKTKPLQCELISKTEPINNIIVKNVKESETSESKTNVNKQNTTDSKKSEHQEQNKDLKNLKKKAIITKLTNTSKGSISSFFEKQQIKTVNKSSSEAKSENTESKNALEKTVDKQILDKDSANSKLKNTERIVSNISVKDNSIDKAASSTSENIPKLNEKSAKNNKKVSKSNKTRSKKKSKNIKKLKRIIVFDNSSSSDEESEEDPRFSEPEDIPEIEPESPKKEEKEPAAIIVHGKKRKRKVIEKTELSSDGFFHTTKEIVYESYSSDENENIPNNENLNLNKRLKVDEIKSDINDAVKASAIEIKSKVKSKQSSIMNFFKKPESVKS